jgi:hypothetical protein
MIIDAGAKIMFILKCIENTVCGGAAKLAALQQVKVLSAEVPRCHRSVGWRKLRSLRFLEKIPQKCCGEFCPPRGN